MPVLVDEKGVGRGGERVRLGESDGEGGRKREKEQRGERGDTFGSVGGLGVESWCLSLLLIGLSLCVEEGPSEDLPLCMFPPPVKSRVKRMRFYNYTERLFLKRKVLMEFSSQKGGWEMATCSGISPVLAQGLWPHG